MTLETPMLESSEPLAEETFYPNAPRHFIEVIAQMELWNEVKKFVIDNVELVDEREYDVITAWIFLTWTPELWAYFIYLHVYGSYKTGKTRLQEVLEQLVRNPLMASHVTEATVYRELAKGCTLIIDEFSLHERSIMLRVLNAGHKPKGRVGVCKRTNGDWEAVFFPVGGFKCFAGTYGIPQTLRSRSITIRMRKTRKRYRFDDEQKKRAEKIRKKLEEWRNKVMEITKGLSFEIPKEIDDFIFETSGKDGRLTDLFTIIYVITPKQRREVLVEYLKDVGEQELQEELASFEAEVFGAILKVYEQQGGKETWFATRDVVDEYNKEKPSKEKATTRRISDQIKVFGFKPYRDRNKRGYKWDESLMKDLKERWYPNQVTLVTEMTEQRDNVEDACFSFIS